MSTKITELKYSNTNTYLLSGKRGALLFDTGWAGTFPLLCRTLGEKKLRLQDIDFLLISHYHPDHMGIAQELVNAGVKLAAVDIQLAHLHSSDHIFEKENNSQFVPINDKAVNVVSIAESRSFLKELGISGEIIHTPGHSEDSISLWLDKEKALFVGDLNPLYELDMHKGTLIYETWQRLLSLKPRQVYYGHARPAELTRADPKKPDPPEQNIFALVKTITKLADKGFTLDEIRQKTNADSVFISDVIRMYVTHPNVSVQGILDRIEIKGK